MTPSLEPHTLYSGAIGRASKTALAMLLTGWFPWLVFTTVSVSLFAFAASLPYYTLWRMLLSVPIGLTGLLLAQQIYHRHTGLDAMWQSLKTMTALIKGELSYRTLVAGYFLVLALLYSWKAQVFPSSHLAFAAFMALGSLEGYLILNSLNHKVSLLSTSTVFCKTVFQMEQKQAHLYCLKAHEKNQEQVGFLWIILLMLIGAGAGLLFPPLLWIGGLLWYGIAYSLFVEVAGGPEEVTKAWQHSQNQVTTTEPAVEMDVLQ